jgi:hypothetical protein
MPSATGATGLTYLAQQVPHTLEVLRTSKATGPTYLRAAVSVLLLLYCLCFTVSALPPLLYCNGCSKPPQLLYCFTATVVAKPATAAAALPLRSTEPHTPYALCLMPYALCLMPYAL